MSTLETLRSRLEVSIALREKATKGEWVARYSEAVSLTADDGGKVCIMTHLKGAHGRLGRRDANEVEANAAHIADAHNPYAEALVALVNEIAEAPHGFGCASVEGLPDPTCDCWKSRAIERAEAVLNAEMSDSRKETPDAR